VFIWLTLIVSCVKLVKAFAPEHGFRVMQDAGAKIKMKKDPKTNLPVLLCTNQLQLH